MTKFTIYTLTAALVMSLSGVASAAPKSPATIGGKADTSINFSSPIKSGKACQATFCGPQTQSQKQDETRTATPAPAATQKCQATYCGPR